MKNFFEDRKGVILRGRFRMFVLSSAMIKIVFVSNYVIIEESYY